MIRFVTAIVIASALGIGSASAQGTSCPTQVMSKGGKALHGRARAKAIKRCCEQVAGRKDGKSLFGATKSDAVNRCIRDAL